MKKILVSLCLLCITISIHAQEYFPKNDGVKTSNTNYTVFKNATIHTSPTTTIANGTLIIQQGKITAVGTTVSIPPNSTIIDLKGKHIYASFIDLYTSFGITLPKNKFSNPYGGNPQYHASREGYYWNDHIRPETDALTDFKYNTKKADALIKEGFGVVNTHVPDGIARGTGLLVALNNKGTRGDRLISEQSGQFFSFTKSSKSKQLYPTSLMGSIALLRQMHYDADWYAQGNASTKDLSLEALNAHKKLPQFFEAGSRIDGFRADKIGDEFGIQYTIIGGGDEYARMEQVVATNATYILPIHFPAAYDMTDPYMANLVSLADMRHWNQAPSNPATLAKKNVAFALTTHQLKKVSDFTTHLKKAIRYGLSTADALAALTTIPAKILKKEALLGRLQKGAYANFLITSDELFKEGTILYENWVQGHKNSIHELDQTAINGTYDLTIGDTTYQLSITGKPTKPVATIKLGDTTIGNTLSYKNDWVSMILRDPDTTKTTYTRIVTSIADNAKNWKGTATLSDGSTTGFTATFKKGNDTKKQEEKEKKQTVVYPVTYPNIAYGTTQLPTATHTLFKNATVWTNESSGILEAMDVRVKAGKIVEIGKNLATSNATVIDATGKHLTAGIIDEHSHIAAAAINEAGHNSSAEVTIEDVITPDDINIYRNLAGGVTSIQILHGSANPIGGRSAILKLKWGESADQLLYPNSPKFIKFALGENVKQSNWPSYSRFPQSRMGVEQVYVDYFTRAQAYEKLKKSGKPYRKDTEMETLVEVLNNERYISCHSYVQSEINMLMKLTERFGFRVNTFTHILEGYKVADKMAAHGVGGSTFSDWWAYKYEVNDAIPYNAAIMHRQGVTVAINSDDNEMARRLNQEAAKSVKYGNISEEEAWKFVTLNPAKLLHIDDRVGSIKEGKDADLVLWSTHPLSIYAKAEKTMIDGAIYFDIVKDKAARKAIQKEKNELIQLMIQDKNKGLKTQTPKKKEKQHFHCDTVESIH